MYKGEDTIDWLYETQLQVDDEWAVRTEKGFKWWAADHAQTVELLGEFEHPALGMRGYCISVRTELLKAAKLDADALMAINLTLMPFASMAGPVFDQRTGTLDLCSWVLVHEDNHRYMNALLSVAGLSPYNGVNSN